MMHSLQSHVDMMIKLWFLAILLSATSISGHPSKSKRSLFEPWLGPPTGPGYGSGAPWLNNPNPWKSLRITSDLYPAPPKWGIPKPPPVVITKEIRVPVDKFIPVEVAKYVPYPVEKLVPVPVEKIIQVPVDRIVQVPVDRIVRIPVEVPAAPAAVPQMVAVAPAPAMQQAAPVMMQAPAVQQAPIMMQAPAVQQTPVMMQAPVAMPVQQPLMLRPGTQFPIVITAQGLSISTSGLIAGGDQMPVQSAPMAPPPMPQPVAAPIPPSPVSNNSTVGISLILNGLAPQRIPQGIRPTLTYVNVLPDVPPEPILGNTLGPEIPLNDNIIELFKQGGGLRWRRNTHIDADN